MERCIESYCRVARRGKYLATRLIILAARIFNAVKNLHNTNIYVAIITPNILVNFSYIYS